MDITAWLLLGIIILIIDGRPRRRACVTVTISPEKAAWFKTPEAQKQKKRLEETIRMRCAGKRRG
jgi:hypothetical protein